MLTVINEYLSSDYHRDIRLSQLHKDKDATFYDLSVVGASSVSATQENGIVRKFKISTEKVINLKITVTWKIADM
ncbi:MAG: hypothetical protein ABI288_11465 [Ginsengibacter sp.]